MTNLTELSQNWQAIQVSVPDLLLPITDDESLMRVTAAVRELSEQIQATTSGPHPLDSLIELASGRIMAYEEAHWPPAAPDMELRVLLDVHKLTQQQLAEATGIDQGTISKLASGKRSFSADHARKLAAYFGVNAGVFL